MGSSKPPVVDGYDRFDLESDIYAAARLARAANLALIAMLETGSGESDLEAVAEVTSLASDAAARVMRVCGDAPDDTDWLGLRPREAAPARRAPT